MKMIGINLVKYQKRKKIIAIIEIKLNKVKVQQWYIREVGSWIRIK